MRGPLALAGTPAELTESRRCCAERKGLRLSGTTTALRHRHLVAVPGLERKRWIDAAVTPCPSLSRSQLRTAWHRPYTNAIRPCSRPCCTEWTGLVLACTTTAHRHRHRVAGPEPKRKM